MKNIYFMGIDIGTGSTKALAVTPQGEVLFATHVAYPTLHPLPGYCEQTPELIWQAFVTCIVRTREHLQHDPQAICLSSAMHSVISVNEQGEPLMNMMTWADNRSAGVAKRLRQSPAGQTVYEQTGTPIHAMSPLCKLVWLRENDPDLFQRTAKFISIKEYIWFRLFQHFEIDYSIASATGLFDIIKHQWNSTALTLAGIHVRKLSHPVPTSTMRNGVATELSQTLGIGADVPFLIGASDGCLANLGSFATTPGVAALTIGTSGAIRIGRQKPVYNYKAMPFNYVLDEHTLISGGPINNGGIALKWYAENFLNRPLMSREDFDNLLRPAEFIPPGAERLVFLPYLLGERAPVWNSDACGVFFGVTARHKQEHFTRALLEGITLSLYQIGLSLEADGEHIHQINVSGGFVQSKTWLQILADVFGKTLCLTKTEDASALGAAFMGMKTLGLIGRYEELKQPCLDVIIPNESNHVYYHEKLFPKFSRLYTLLETEMGAD